MKRYSLIILTIFILLSVFFVSCGESDEKFTGIETPNLAYKDGAYILTVSSDVENFDLTSIFSVSDKASFIISRNESFTESVNGDVRLEPGENKYFVKVTDINDNEVVYKFIVNKKRTHNVTFNVNGGSQVATIQCESGQTIEAPVSLKTGYTLEWDYNFSNPVYKDLVINATWKPNSYKITVEGTDTVINVKYGEEFTLTQPEKLGYKFTGWQYNGASFDSTAPYSYDKDIVVAPSYEIEQYSINYITIGGENANPNVYTVEDEVVFKALVWEFEEDSRLIYEFGGWYKDSEYTVPFEKIEKGTTGSIKVYAKWNVTNVPEEKHETTVTISAPGFECDGMTQVLELGESYSLPSLEKNGFIFNGWESADGSFPIPTSGEWPYDGEELTLKPVFKEEIYTITYILNDGENHKDNVTTYTINSSVALLPPEKLYCEFGGWYTDVHFTEKIEVIPQGTYGNITLYAKWNERSFTINYNHNYFSAENTTQAVVLGKKFSLISLERLGYVFEGWFNGDEKFECGEDSVWLLENDITLTAHWTKIAYNLTYDLDGGSVQTVLRDTYDVDEPQNIVLPKPTKEGKIFLGWSLSGEEQIVFNMVIRKGSIGDRHFVAHWCDVKDENGFTYSILRDDEKIEFMVVGYQGVIGKNVKIPAEYNGYPVTTISNKAFFGYGEKISGNSSESGFTTWLIPKTITRIGANAFGNCTNLKVLLDEGGNEEEINAWVQKVSVEEGNDYLIDVIMGKRPAIGWKLYYKPTKQ